jgi:hypothetical protein
MRKVLPGSRTGVTHHQRSRMDRRHVRQTTAGDDAMNRVSALAVMAGAGVLAATAAPARAQQTLSFSTDSATQPDNMLNFNQFDPTLGTLTGVSFALTNSAASVSATITLTGGEAGFGAGEAVVDFLATGPGAGGPGSIQLFGDNQTADVDCPGADCSATNSATGSFSSPATVNGPADLPSYEGAGTFDVDVNVGSLSASTATCMGFSGPTPTCTTTGDATWSGDITVSFQYTPAATEAPEPGTFGLLAAALGGMAMLTRRRRTSQR